MDQNFLKITYHLGVKKMNAYLKMPSPTYHVLKKEIEFCLFEERKQDRCEIRTYWIDEDRDEIEIRNQCDYEIFMAKRSNRLPLHVSPAAAAAAVAAKYPKVNATTSFDPFRFEQLMKNVTQMWTTQMIKNDLRKQFSTNTTVSSTAAAFTQSTPKVSLNRSDGFDFGTLGGDLLKPFNANKAAKDSTKIIEKEKSTNTEKVDATTSPSFDPANFIPICLRQPLDLQSWKNAVQKLNDYNNMCVKMWVPMKNTESSNNQNDSNLRKNSSTNTSVSYNLKSMGLDFGTPGPYFLRVYANKAAKDSTKIIEKEKSTNTEKVDATTSFYPASFNPIEAEQSLKIANQRWAAEKIKNDLLKKISTNTSVSSIAAASTQSTPKVSFNGSDGFDFGTLGPDLLKPFNANKAAKDSTKIIEKEKSTNTEKVNATTSFDPFRFEQSLKNVTQMWTAQMIKNDLRKKFSTNTSVSSTAAASTQSTPKVSLNGSDGFDFGTLGGDLLKPFNANKAAKDSTKIIESSTESVDKADEALTSAASVTSATSASTSVAEAAAAPKVSKENRAVIVHQADNNIDNAVHAMMAVGFSNDEGWLTQLLECVNGNISDALKLMFYGQLSENR